MLHDRTSSEARIDPENSHQLPEQLAIPVLFAKKVATLSGGVENGVAYAGNYISRDFGLSSLCCTALVHCQDGRTAENGATPRWASFGLVLCIVVILLVLGRI
jgi:hypothetical protein